MIGLLMALEGTGYVVGGLALVTLYLRLTR